MENYWIAIAGEQGWVRGTREEALAAARASGFGCPILLRGRIENGQVICEDGTYLAPASPSACGGAGGTGLEK